VQQFLALVNRTAAREYDATRDAAGDAAATSPTE
jgi:hypothetical protein